MKGFILSLIIVFSSPAYAKPFQNCPLEKANLKIGDIVFIEASNYVFQRVSVAQGGWMNHVGIVVEEAGELKIAESTIPWVKIDDICRFNNKSKNQKFEVKRLYHELATIEEKALFLLAKDLTKTLYDLGFDIESERQYCSKFVRYLVSEIVGIDLGQKQQLKELYKDQEDSELLFWKTWYGGSIPWERETITPKSLYDDPQLISIAKFPLK